MEALFLKIRFPFYSVAMESFQVKSALILPSPSSLKGALARGIALLRGTCESKIDDVGRKIVEEINTNLVDVCAAYAGPSTPIVPNSFLLKLLRNLEPERKDKKYDPERSDAMRREYYYTKELIVAYIFKDLNDTQKEEYLKAAMMIDSIGDTESLAAVIDARFVKVENKSAPLSFYAPYAEIKSRIQYIPIEIMNMYVNPNYENDEREGSSRRREVPKKKKEFYMPITMKRLKLSIFYDIAEHRVESDWSISFDKEVHGVWMPKMRSQM